ncbi:hypothetical protein [Litoribacillus peritrichatus]|uniref:Uncharacterized protein n=1 Tax=Litoribacillus peritrichatus TaxID=718191 RepID=A0ABP7MW45_9GAMM
MVNTSARYKLTSAILACFLYGGWAYFINSGAGALEGLTSGVAQGIASFILTLFIVMVVTKLYHMINAGSRLKVIIPAGLTAVGVAIILSLIHWLIGTDHILPTILPSIIVASVFCVVTGLKLAQMTGD